MYNALELFREKKNKTTKPRGALSGDAGVWAKKEKGKKGAAQKRPPSLFER